MNKFKVVTYYDREDEEFGGDYRDVVLFVNNKPVLRFGDDYHDKGLNTCEGYCRCLIDMGHCSEVEYVDQHLPKKSWEFFEGKLYSIQAALK